MITDAPDGDHLLVGADDSSADLDCTPASLAIAPYATIGRALYGQYALSFAAGAATNYTVDFWVQYIYAENQVLFNVGTSNEKVKLIQSNAECYLFELEDDTCPMFNEMTMSRLFYQLGYHNTCEMFDTSESCPMFALDSAMFDNREPDEPYHAGWKYYTRTETDEGEIFTLLEITEGEYYAYLSNIWTRTCEYNTPRDQYEELQHIVNGTVSEAVDLKDLDIDFEPNAGLHFGIIAGDEKVCVCVDKTSHCFDRVEFSRSLSVSLSENKNSFMLDELLIDTTAAETKEAFFTNTDKRIPFGTLDETQNWFILSAQDTTKVKTNLFETSVFKAAVDGILSDHGLI